MSIKTTKGVRYLPVAFGTSALIALAATGMYYGMAVGNAGSVMESKTQNTDAPISTYVEPHVAQMQMGQTAGEEPIDLPTTTTAAAGH